MIARAVLPLLLLAPLETDHWRLDPAPGDEARAGLYGRLLELAWDGFDDVIDGRRPKLAKGERLEVRPVDDGPTRLVDGAAAVAVALPAGEAAARRALLYAAARLYHARGPCRGEPPADSWYVHGLALHASTHAWDGRRLELGVRPLVAPTDLVGGALGALGDPAFDLAAAVAGDVPMPDALAWGLVHWLATGRDGRPHRHWSAFQRKANAGQSLGQLFEHEFGEPADLVADFRNWLANHRQPFVAATGDWAPLGEDGLVGSAEGMGLCPTAGRAREIQATIRVPSERRRWLGGVLLHYEDPRNYSIFLIDWAGHLRAHRFVGGSRRIMEQGPGPGPDEDGTYRLRVFRERGAVYVMLGLQSYGPYELPGERLGLAIDGCTLPFTAVRTE